MDAKKECAARLKELRNEYRYTAPDEMEEGNIEVRKIKWIIENRLTAVEQTILLLYVETGSLRKLGELLDCSHSTIRPEVNEIKAKVQEELEKMKDIKNI